MDNWLRVCTAFEKLTGHLPLATTLNDRIAIQKVAYLLKKIGMRLDYDFDWYIYGTFSRDLWRETLRNDILSDSKSLSEADVAKIEEIKTMAGLQQYLLDSDKLQLVTAIIFWAERTKTKINDPQVVEMVHSYKPRFSKEEIAEAVKVLGSNFDSNS